MSKRTKKLLTYFMAAVLAGGGLVSSLNAGQVKAADMYDVFIGNSKRYTVGCAEDWRIVLEAPADEFKSVAVDGKVAPEYAVKSVKAVGYPEGFEPEVPATTEAPAATTEIPVATGYSYLSSNAVAVFAAAPESGSAAASAYKCTEIILNSSWIDTIGTGKHMVTLAFDNGNAYVGIVVTGSDKPEESTTVASTESTTAASGDSDDTDSDDSSSDSINVSQKTDSNGIIIQKFSFKNGALPADTVWMIGNMSDDDIVMLNNNGINAKLGWDINPYSGGVRAQVAPGYKVNVQFALPSDLAYISTAEYKIYDLTYNVYQDAVINNGIVSFDASHFSKYALVEMTAGSGSADGNVTDNASESTTLADAQVTSPKTADTTGVVFWALCMAAAIGAFVVTFAKGRQCK
ncbi:MAG: hypothetical protein MRZ64_07970 [[Bacteroides] pectinophilus]|nr:hypothetical protein [[Bacteroides] pectinophilus]